MRVLCHAVLATFVHSLPQQRWDGLVLGQTPLAKPPGQTTDVEEAYLTQRLDHFDRQSDETFKQRYFVNTRYWKGANTGAPVFLCVGGEGPPLDTSVVTSSVHCTDAVELASRHQALVVALEHRYYGKSLPFEDWATENLHWLNSQQALADLAAFHGHITQQYGLTKSNPWVTWGGSYPGMLAAWARLKYPHLFHAAVSSSSPLRAKLDFPEYDDVIADSLANEAIGGSVACLNAIAYGHTLVGDMLETAEGRETLSSLFNLCDPAALEDEDNRRVFAGDGVAMVFSQENDPSCSSPACDVRRVCNVMTDATWGSEVERLAALRLMQEQHVAAALEQQPAPAMSVTRVLRSIADGCTPVSFELALAVIKTPSFADRAWYYQACSEFGFFQTCEVGTRCPFTQGLHEASLDLRICQEAFGISPDTVAEQVEFTNQYYGADTPSGSRIMFPNGEVDPWHAMGVLRSPGPEEPVLMVPGASHHFWTHPSKDTDSSEVVAARHAIWKQVDQWLQPGLLWL